MGILSWLFGSNETQTTQTNQPEGFFWVRHDYGETQARALLQRANAGDVNAVLTIAKCLLEAPDGPPLALPWYEKAAELGSSAAAHKLTLFYEGHYVGVEANPAKAAQIQNKALSSNNPKAYLKLGSQYYMGSGVKLDKKKAFEYYMKAAKLDDDEGKAEVGLCYLNGDGVERNYIEAYKWLSQSKDTFYGYYNLAQCYLKGLGTEKNLEKATICLEKAVEGKCLDLDQARRQLASLYSKGYGGANVAAKLNRLKQQMSNSNDLLDRLINEMDG